VTDNPGICDIRSLAIRFADLWAVDHHQMVDEIYAPTIHMESMAGLGRSPIEGSAQLHALEDRLAAMIPQHRHELVRIVAEQRHACLETTVMGPSTGEYAPACVWWWRDDGGQVGDEVGFFDWEARTTDSGRSHGFVPPNDHRPRGPSEWYRGFIDALASAWTNAPTTMIEHWFAPDCVVERVGGRRYDGVGAVQAAQDELTRALPIGERWVEVQQVAADGAVVAVLFACGKDRLASRGTVVLTLDPLDRISSLRAYWDWSTAVPFEDIHPSVRVPIAPVIR
jgi:hypothetical protein